MLHGHMCAWPETDNYVWHQRRTIQSARHSKHRCPDPLGSGLTWGWSISWVLYWSRRLWLVCCQMMQPVQMKCWTDSNQNRLCQNIISLSGWMPCRVSLKSWGSVAENVTRAVLKLNQPELLDTYLFFLIFFSWNKSHFWVVRRAADMDWSYGWNTDERGFFIFYF